MAGGLPYNGWPEEIRHGRDPHYYHARTRGVLPAASSCHACGMSFGSGPVPYHAEEYGPTLEDYWASCVALCHRCHAMIHSRFATPNLWKQFLTQLAAGTLDEAVYPQNTQIVALLSKFKNRPDIGFVPMPMNGNDYLMSLPTEEYRGLNKVATLLVFDQRTCEPVEVPDWTVYGELLETLDADGQKTLRARGVAVDEFLAGRIKIARSPSGRLKYERLYLLMR